MKLKFWRLTPPPPSPPDLRPPWSQPFDVKPLLQRLGNLPPDDPLYPLLLGYLDATIVHHADTRVSDDAAAHQYAGRLGMVATLRSDLTKLWHDAHRPRKQT